MATIYDPHDLLRALHPDLITVLEAAMFNMPFDLQVVCTYRSTAAQLQAYNAGTSHARPGQSPHNFYPAQAADLCPMPIDWNKTARFQQMWEVIEAASATCGIAVTWGGAFTHLKDYDHVELTNWRTTTAPNNEQGK